MTWLPINHGGNKFFEECVKITNDEELFANFKRNEIFTGVIGNDIRSKEIADILYNNLPERLKFKSADGDKYGNPVIYEYPEGKISPGTLTFLNVLHDLENNFGSIRGWNVVEIGGGHGGLAKILLDAKIKSYTDVDVPEVLGLARKYLGLFGYKNVDFLTAEDEIGNFDLAIGNWSWSEMDRNGIEFYCNKVIKNCKAGYFLMNLWDAELRTFLLDLVSRDFTYGISPEVPRTSQFDNWLLVIKRK